MKKFNTIILLAFSLILNSCQMIGDIFGAGFYAGIFVVLIIIGIIIAIIAKVFNRK